MTSKPQAPGPNPTRASTIQQAKPRKAAATQNPPKHTNLGRAGSAGGIVLEERVPVKTKTTGAQDPSPNATSSPNKPRRKPRKLNKEPTSPSAQKVTSPAKTPIASADVAANTELEALKSRVRGLEAKVEQLITGTETKGPRSPRRRGKGRKASSSTQVPTISNLGGGATNTQEVDDNPKEEEDADEELIRLEGELEIARRDLQAFRPRNQRSTSQRSNEIEVEEIRREEVGLEDNDKLNNNRHVTLSGSYRIPLPTSVSMDDVKTIQNGVSAAQNVARSFFEQRRAATTTASSSSPSSSSRDHAKSNTTTPSQHKPAPTRSSNTPKTVSSSLQVAVLQDQQGAKQSWSDWIGGYSMAITRAVKSIEHEAFVERERDGKNSARQEEKMAQGKGNGNGNANANANAKGRAKRPAVGKAKMSSEQVKGLLS